MQLEGVLGLIWADIDFVARKNNAKSEYINIDELQTK